MPATATHAPGTFCWLDLGAYDAEAANRFYTAFFGWTAVPMKYGGDEGDVYTMYQLDGKDVAASYAMDANQKAMGIPTAWLSYVAVENADEAAARAKALGGSIVAGPFDVMQVGRMALVQDPTGAVFALWQTGTHAGVGVRDEPGSLTWTELMTNDPAKAREFYTSLFGWNAQTQDMGMGMEYTVFTGPGGAMRGGMYQIRPEMGAMPGNWTPYFAVEDADAAAEKAKQLGAVVMMEPQDIPGVGRFAMFRDPQGAMFYVIRLAMPA
jgi:predicted enzyme related to lactoylglutathione lyase